MRYTAQGAVHDLRLVTTKVPEPGRKSFSRSRVTSIGSAKPRLEGSPGIMDGSRDEAAKSA